MEVLGAAASIASLIDVTFKICQGLHNFISSYDDAPKTAAGVVFAVKEMRLILNSARDLLMDLSTIPGPRRSMIELDHFIIIVVQSTTTLLNVERAINPFILHKALTATALSKLSLEWLRVESKIKASLEQLEMHKSSLSLMLNILKHKCDIDASLFQIELKTSMEQILRRDIRMQQRLARLELTCAIRPTSMKFLNCDDDDNWIITPTTTQAGSQSSKQVSTTKTAGTTRRYSLMTSPREFELILGTSRVYRRVEGNECDMSFGDSDVRTHAWSILSGLSLSDISVISVIALPLSTAEVQQLQRALMAPVPPEFTRFQLERARDGIAVSAIKKEQDKYKLLKTCNFKGCNCSFADGKALMAHSKTGPSLSGLEVYTSVASEGDTKEEENATEAKPMADTAETEVIATEATIDPRTSVTLTEARIALEAAFLDELQKFRWSGQALRDNSYLGRLTRPEHFLVMATTNFDSHMDHKTASFPYLHYQPGDFFHVVLCDEEMILARKQNVEMYGMLGINKECEFGWISKKSVTPSETGVYIDLGCNDLACIEEVDEISWEMGAAIWQSGEWVPVLPS